MHMYIYIYIYIFIHVLTSQLLQRGQEGVGQGHDSISSISTIPRGVYTIRNKFNVACMYRIRNKFNMACRPVYTIGNNDSMRRVCAQQEAHPHSAGAGGGADGAGE